MVILRISFQAFIRGPGYWKLNTEFLHDIDYIDRINEVIDIQLDNEPPNLSKKNAWELLKLAVSRSSLQYGAQKHKSDKNKLEVLNKKLKQIELATSNQIGLALEDSAEQMSLIRKEIYAINAKRTRGAILCSCSKHEMEADTPSKYYLNLEKRNFNNKTIYRLMHDGCVLEKEEDILNAQMEFYRQLYHTRGPMYLPFIDDLNFNQVNQEDKKMLDSPITPFELGYALKNLNNGKVGGCNGIAIDWYKIFWGKIKYLFYDMVKECVQEKKLHLSARRGVISLLGKPDDDPLFLKGWCPLTLLNSDYKIIAKVLAMRLDKTTPYLLNDSQTGFNKGFSANENLKNTQRDGTL